jgi:hypothetical protein
MSCNPDAALRDLRRGSEAGLRRGLPVHSQSPGCERPDDFVFFGMHQRSAIRLAGHVPLLLSCAIALCAGTPSVLRAQADPLAAFAGLEGWWSGTIETRDTKGASLVNSALLEAHRSLDGTHAVLRFMVRRDDDVFEQSDLFGFDTALRTLYRLSLAGGEEHRFDYPLQGGDVTPDPFHWVLVRTRRGYDDENAHEYRTTDVLDGDALGMLTESRQRDGAFQFVSRYSLHRCPPPRPAAWVYADTSGVVSAAVAGDFNNWSPAHLPMRRIGREWRGQAVLPAGTYRYRLIVNGRSIADPSNPRSEKDARGFTTSILVVPEPER